MKRVRFLVPLTEANGNDSRPIIYPTQYPCWCTGSSKVGDIYVAFTPDDNPLAYVQNYWPEVTSLDWVDDRDKVTYSGRFPQPETHDEFGNLLPTYTPHRAGPAEEELKPSSSKPMSLFMAKLSKLGQDSLKRG